MKTTNTEKSLKEKILEIIVDNAEEPEEVKNGEGTFVTYRLEYLINDLDSLFSQAKRETIKEFESKLISAYDNTTQTMGWHLHQKDLDDLKSHLTDK